MERTRDDSDVELTPLRCPELQCLAGLCGQETETLAHHIARSARKRVGVPGCPQESDGLDEEERVPLRRREQTSRDLRVVSGLLDEILDGAPREARETDRLRMRSEMDRVRGRGAEFGIGVAPRREDRDRRAVDRVGDEPEERERRLVRDVEILERDGNGPVLGQPAQEPQDGVEQPEPRLALVERRERRQIGRERFGHERGERSESPELGRWNGGDELAQDIGPGPEWRSSTRLPRPAERRAERAGTRLLDEQPRERGLPDAGFAGHDQQTTAAARRQVECREETLGFGLPPDERFVHERHLSGGMGR